MEETPPNPKPTRPRGRRVLPRKPVRPEAGTGAPTASSSPSSSRARGGSAIVRAPCLRHVDMGVLPVDRAGHVVLAAEGCGDQEGRLIEGLSAEDFAVTLVDVESGLLVRPVVRDRLSEIGAGLYRYAVERLARPGRHQILVTDTHSPPRFHPILGRIEARYLASPAFAGSEPEITASIVFVSSANLIKARVGVRQGGRRVPVDEVTLELYDERSRTPIRLEPIPVESDSLGLAELEARGAVAQGLRIYAAIVAVRIGGEVYESTRLFPVVRVAP